MQKNGKLMASLWQESHSTDAGGAALHLNLLESKGGTWADVPQWEEESTASQRCPLWQAPSCVPARSRAELYPEPDRARHCSTRLSVRTQRSPPHQATQHSPHTKLCPQPSRGPLEPLGHVQPYDAHLSKTKHALVPPKPKEFDITRWTWTSCLAVKILRPSASSTRSSMLMDGARKPFSVMRME